MYAPRLRYLVSSPYGDIPVNENNWYLPLEGDPLKTPYEKYFCSIKTFIFQDEFNPLLIIVGTLLGRAIQIQDIIEIIIRAEKHGALYHPSSIEIILNDSKVKLALNVAVTDTGKASLKEEFSVIQLLNNNFNLSYLPKVYRFVEIDTKAFLLGEWFEGYHEFHISQDNEGKQRLKLWDFGSGYRYISKEQTFEIYRQASKILTLYYDVKGFRQIYPWHNAAGDFVAKIKADKDSSINSLSNGSEKDFSTEKTDVRLTTVRRYEPIMAFTEKDAIHPVLSLVYLFFNTSLRMRLDKHDGVGKVLWADDNCVDATVKGFFEALEVKEDCLDYIGSKNEFLKLLKSLSRVDLEKAFYNLTELYEGTSDLPVIKENIKGHAAKMHATLQNFLL